MRIIKIIIYITVILILICICGLIFLQSETNNNNNNNTNTGTNSKTEVNENSINEKYPNRDKVDVKRQDISTVKNRTDFFTVQSIVNKYLNIIVSGDQNKLRDILDKEYLQNNDINMIQSYNNIQLFTAEKIYYRVENNISTYFVYGIIEEDIMDEKMPENEFNITVVVDYNNNTFSIIPKEIENIDTYKYTTGNIDVNDNNTYTTVAITDENMANLYLNEYRDNAMYNSEKAYDLLNSEYRNKKFGSLEKYKEYVNKRVSKIALLKLDKYLIKERENYTEYTLIDTDGNYYIFQENAPMQYTVILDTYTINIPEFIEKYDKAYKRDKVIMNIERFFEAINLFDYEYAYGKLDESFKNKYFSSLSEFEEYAKENFEYDEKIDYIEFSDSDGIYTYDIELKNGENIIQKTFTVKLLEGTDYKLSFNVK